MTLLRRLTQLNVLGKKNCPSYLFDADDGHHQYDIRAVQFHLPK